MFGIAVVEVGATLLDGIGMSIAGMFAIKFLL